DRDGGAAAGPCGRGDAFEIGRLSGAVGGQRLGSRSRRLRPAVPLCEVTGQLREIPEPGGGPPPRREPERDGPGPAGRDLAQRPGHPPPRRPHPPAPTAPPPPPPPLPHPP